MQIYLTDITGSTVSIWKLLPRRMGIRDALPAFLRRPDVSIYAGLPEKHSIFVPGGRPGSAAAFNFRRIERENTLCTGMRRETNPYCHISKFIYMGYQPIRHTMAAIGI